MAIHLWFNGDDHSFGETAEEATKNGQAMWGLSAEEAEGDGWTLVPDDTTIRDDDSNDCGTAKEWAESMAAFEGHRVPGATVGGLPVYSIDIDPASPRPAPSDGAPRDEVKP